MRYLTTLFFFLFYLAFAFAQSGMLVLTNANIIDGISDKIINNATVVITNGKIQSIATEKVNPPQGATVLDLKGKYLMPGLIDAHVHIRTFADAKRALLSGVTTARSMGVAHFLDIGMRELSRKGVLDMPEILAAGYHVRHTPDDAFFMDAPEMSGLMKNGVKTVEEVRKMTQVMVDHKVDWIKVNATARAGLAETDPREPYYNEAQMRAIVETGAKANIPVAAHAHGDEGARAAVLAGVTSIEHGTYLSEETLKIMAEKGAYLVPTMAVVRDLTVPGGDYDIPALEIRGKHMLPRIQETVANALRLGVKIVAATDTGYGPDGVLRLSQEMEELANAGLSPLQVIQSATSLAAELLRINNRTGKIAVGMEADILVIERNPFEYLKAVHDPLLIVNNGKVVLNRLVWEVSGK
ncbi:MAG: amidohydrolase family protein [Saprospiraceae bacterium]|nr:amidohydrolase family protein [Saprospiraceae bacterium]